MRRTGSTWAFYEDNLIEFQPWLWLLYPRFCAFPLCFLLIISVSRRHWEFEIRNAAKWGYILCASNHYYRLQLRQINRILDVFYLIDIHHMVTYSFIRPRRKMKNNIFFQILLNNIQQPNFQELLCYHVLSSHKRFIWNN